MLDGYHLKGISDEYVLVFRSDDSEMILGIIQRLMRSGNRELKAVATQLEKEWFEREAEKHRGKR